MNFDTLPPRLNHVFDGSYYRTIVVPEALSAFTATSVPNPFACLDMPREFLDERPADDDSLAWFQSRVESVVAGWNATGFSPSPHE